MNKVTQSIYKKKVDDLEQGGGAPKLYEHLIRFYSTNSVDANVVVYANDNTIVNSHEIFKNFIQNQGFMTNEHPEIYAFYGAGGTAKTSGNSPVTFTVKSIYTVSGSIRLDGFDATLTVKSLVLTGAVTITDIVKEVL